LQSRRLTPRLMDHVLYSIALLDRNQMNGSVTTGEGVSRMRQFLNSLGRFGEGAFIYCRYGTSELPQAYSR
jgi:RAB protein geranylgeranyltransferase component A